MKLPLDVALCAGAGEPICDDCVRRTAERPPIGWYMAPPASGDDCDCYMEPDEVAITEAGRKALEGRK